MRLTVESHLRPQIVPLLESLQLKVIAFCQGLLRNNPGHGIEVDVDEVVRVALQQVLEATVQTSITVGADTSHIVQQALDAERARDVERAALARDPRGWLDLIQGWRASPPDAPPGETAVQRFSRVARAFEREVEEQRQVPGFNAFIADNPIEEVEGESVTDRLHRVVYTFHERVDQFNQIQRSQ